MSNSIMPRAKILGCGTFLPNRILHNTDLEKFLDTTNEWIQTRTGIKQRHIAENDTLAVDLAYGAASSAIKNANILASDIDLVIVATTTPDNTFPSVATKLQSMLSMQSTPAFDLQAVCSGFIYGINVADCLIRSGRYKNILLVCAEKMTSLLDWSDRSTCILFGDGAASVVITASDDDSRIIDTQIYSDGLGYDMLYTDGGVNNQGISGKIRMNGREVFKHGIEKMTASILTILQNNNIDIQDIDYFIPHQANERMIDSIAQKVSLPESKLVKTIDFHGNCSSASIPLALGHLLSKNTLKTGDKILFVSFGAGFTWGAAIVQW